MPVRNPSEIAAFDAAAAFDAVERAADGLIYSFIEFDLDDFNPIYVDDATLNFYEDEEQMLQHFEEIHSFANLDFMEMELFTNDLFPIADEVQYLTVTMDYLKIVRAYRDEHGVFLAIQPDESVVPLMSAFDETVATEIDGE